MLDRGVRRMTGGVVSVGTGVFGAVRGAGFFRAGEGLHGLGWVGRRGGLGGEEVGV